MECKRSCGARRIAAFWKARLCQAVSSRMSSLSMGAPSGSQKLMPNICVCGLSSTGVRAIQAIGSAARRTGGVAQCFTEHIIIIVRKLIYLSGPNRCALTKKCPNTAPKLNPSCKWLFDKLFHGVLKTRIESTNWSSTFSRVSLIKVELCCKCLIA